MRNGPSFRTQEGGRAALAVMEGHLREWDWFVGDSMTTADIALYAYTHVADEGGFDLARYPAVGDWLERVAAQPGHVAMNPAPEGIVSPADIHSVPRTGSVQSPPLPSEVTPASTSASISARP